MADDMTIFVAFAIEDESIRNMIKGQSLHTKTPFSYVDMSVKEAYDEEWKKKVRTRILRSDGVLVIVSKNSTRNTAERENRLRPRPTLRLRRRARWIAATYLPPSGSAISTKTSSVRTRGIRSFSCGQSMGARGGLRPERRRSQYKTGGE
jgi:hypothetical protein